MPEMLLVEVIRFFVWLRFRQRMLSDRMHPHLTLLAPDEMLSGKSEAAWPLSRVLRIRKSSDGLYPAFYSRSCCVALSEQLPCIIDGKAYR